MTERDREICRGECQLDNSDNREEGNELINGNLIQQLRR